MPNNIFLSGGINTGKTTIIKRLLKKYRLDPGGFMVGRDGKPFYWSRFYLLPADFYCNNSNSEVEKYKDRGIFATRDEDEIWEIDSTVFDNYGVELLSKGQKSNIILMDELGRLERNAFDFQDKVFELLQDDIPVIGVIKDEKNKFLDRVRDCLKLAPLGVKRSNRKLIYNKAELRLKKILGEKKDDYSSSSGSR